MMRSMFSGVTGLRNHQIKMDVIGNNIANVNTVGYKKSRVTFQDTLSQTMRGASSAQGNRGGTNPMQIGLGMTIAAIDTIHTPTSLEATGNMTDLAIEGDGFFILSDGQGYYYTRAGNFGFDEQGNLVNTANGFKVMGWQDSSSKTPQDIKPINIQKGMLMPAKPTDIVVFAKNLNKADQVVTIPFKVYDSLGRAHNLTITFTNNGDNTWDYDISFDPTLISVSSGSDTGTLAFDPNGNLSGGSTINSVTLTIVGANPITFTPDFSNVTQYAKETTVDLSYQNGYPAGTLLGISVDSTGTITGVFDNGQTMELAQVALAVFNNPAGLMKAGRNMYTYSNNSGEPQIGLAGTGGRGTISPGSLEMSNVDLAEEFTQMIITQRGFQANSRVITASDEMLQELVNIKR
ncbi:flagellar hook protein FlgE [Thermosediminibacter oceani]|uniref:Flagellar hook protein FlgE n=1 Tax=Thermosediminibacter oceani (strain ATCC BAA-1034 / DSM 16646 / JW/IW-1228P) TaxID=555079 RepID=D9S388_THEOJ|nr:flagellar hook protein FlgE [Thermosediminibacter oceani]ADL07865.1 fagellar hook-basal body protein [Thermosediminibacter oceani DSM 16646]